MGQLSILDPKFKERQARAKKIVAWLKKEYPEPKTELAYDPKYPFQLVASVIMSAQSTDKAVNRLTEGLWKKYKTVDDFADANLATFTNELSSITFYQNKARHIIGAAQFVRDQYGGRIPKTIDELTKLPGVAYKTANVVLGELYHIWDGIPTDTHVRRFALRFDLTHNKDLTKISKDLEALIPKEDWKYVNNGLVLYGRYVCNALPHECSNHPLTKIYPPAGMLWPKSK
jgi:endonuclease-3